MPEAAPNQYPAHIDDDESGRFFDRSAYSRMMDDVENGKNRCLHYERPYPLGRDYLK